MPAAKKGDNMRKIIIDTDTASDDAVAILMALRSEEVEVLAVTTVAGNVPLEQATKNALMTIKIAGAQKPKVYPGCSRPIFRELITAESAHGNDGMGDKGLIHPVSKPEETHGVDAILKYVKEYPGEVELIVIGPATNIAVAIFQEPETMKKVKRIYTMGTAGFGKGNTTPVAEYNVYADAESYHVMLTSGIPVTIVGFDMCLGDAALNRDEIEQMRRSESPVVRFAVDCNEAILAMNIRRSGEYIIDLPDPVTMGVALYPEIVKETVEALCSVSYLDKLTYGEVVIEQKEFTGIGRSDAFEPNADVVKSIDGLLFKEKLLEALH